MTAPENVTSRDVPPFRAMGLAAGGTLMAVIGLR